jgi:periplasmic protein CpxP/Spy
MIQRFRSKAVVIGAALALAVGLASAVHAQGEGPGRRGGFGFGGPGGPGRGGFPFAALNLTDAQREQVKTVMQQHRDEMEAAGKQLHDAFDAQQKAIETIPVNEGLIRSTSQSLANAQADMAVLRARIHSEVWSLLTPEQQAKAKELKAQREARMKERQQERQQRRQQRQQG